MRDQRRDQRVVVGERAVDQRRRVGIGTSRAQDRARRPLREQRPRRGESGEVDQHVGVERGERLRVRRVEGIGSSATRRHAARDVILRPMPGRSVAITMANASRGSAATRERAARRGVDRRPPARADDAQRRPALRRGQRSGTAGANASAHSAA